MAKGSNIGAVIFLAILALGGLGLSGYMFINDQFLGGDEHTHDLIPHEHEGYELVAVWEQISGSGNDFYLNVSYNQLPQNEFCGLTDGNTTFNLTQKGWYRFAIQTTWNSLLATEDYSLAVEKNEIETAKIMYLFDPPEIYWSMNLVHYVYSDGDDLFRFFCQSFNFDSFGISPSIKDNQIVLEYIEDI